MEGASEGKTVVVHGRGGSASCGTHFREGKRYTVRLPCRKTEDGSPATDTCLAPELLTGAEANPQGLQSPGPALPVTERVPSDKALGQGEFWYGRDP